MSITITPGQASQVAPAPMRDAGIGPNDARGAAQPPADKLALGDKVTLGAAVEPPATYGDPRLSPEASAARLDAILAESESQTQQIMNLILPLIEQQGLNLAKVISGEEKLSADPASIEKAKAAIADDGEYGVEQVAARILDFARSAIGDDPSKLATFKAAVEEGFEQAAQMLGGTLPEISEKTRAAVMATFDRWEKDGMQDPASPDSGTVAG